VVKTFSAENIESPKKSIFKEKSMKITKIEQFKLAVPHIPAIQKKNPTAHTDSPVNIIRVYTDEDIIGIGEGGYGGDITPQIPQWIGLYPLAINLATLTAPFQHALYDIVGKVLGLPAYRLMGTCYRDKVPVGYWSCPMEPEETAKEAEVGARLGFKNHKLKARPWNIVKTCHLMTEVAGPDYSITVDPNFTFESLPQSIRLAHQLEKYNIQCFEDPFNWKHNWHQYALFRQKTEIPIAPHLSNPIDVLHALKAEAADQFNIGGNLDTALRCTDLADAAGLPVWLQVAALGFGISGAFATHVAAVIKNATIPSDSLHFLRENDLVSGALAPKDGFVEVPQTPGLGVELDIAAVEHYRVG
jgi:L-alanine-DL-glutamate epimerase-like enolase superfamily enzyme